MSEELCFCGKPLHYTSDETRRIVEMMIQEKGTHVVVVSSKGRNFLVPRHYIALHGLKEEALPFLGFQEVFE